MDKKMYLSIIAALATAGAVWLLARLAAPIAKPLAWALIIGIATSPHHDRLARKFPHHPNRTAGLMVLAIMVCFILPVAALIAAVAQNASDWYSEVERLVTAFATTGANTFRHFPFLGKVIALGEELGIDLSVYASKFATSSSEFLLDLAANTARNLAELLFSLAVALFILFFIYRDGEWIVSAAIARFTTKPHTARRYVSEIRATTTAVAVGTLFTCFAQGATAGLGYFIADVPAPVLLGALTAVAALIPVVGTGIIWVPIAALMAINGAYLKASILALWCIILVSLADNAIRPLAIGAKSNIPVPAIVLGAIGGVFAMGLLGLILGPVAFAIFITVWREVTTADQPDGHAGNQSRPDE